MSNEPGILPEPIPFGKYYLLERISVGGMAEIYKAKAFGVEGFERLLAVKKILSSIAEDESFIEMFIDEAKIAGKLNHPNIAQIYDLGKVDGSYYIALEYISGKDMKTIFERARRVGEEVDIPQVCHVAMKVCEGLEHAHNKTDSQGRDLDIVHRDISPQNILLSYEGEVKIIDFGIAKAQGKTSQTQVGVLKGKFSYMSPEQVRGLHVDHRSDIFSLGIVLYEMLTLERLFLGESDFDTLEKIRKVEMSPPSLYNPNIPKELEDIVLKALAQNPDDRFQSTRELGEALERFMRNQDHYYKNTDLAEFMKDAFQEDLEFEQKKLEYYQSLDLEPPDETGDNDEQGGDEAGLVWDEEEMETQIFDNEPSVGSTPSRQSGSQPAPAAAQSGAGSGSNAPAPADSRESGAVEVVGPDNKVDTIGPEDEVGPVDEEDGDAPTVEYNRWSVEEQLEDMGANVDESSATEQRPSRRDESTSEVVGPGGQSTGAQSAVERRSSGASSRLLVIGGTAAMIMAGALAVAWFVLWGTDAAELEIAPERPSNVQVYLDGEKVHEGETPVILEADPGTTSIAVKKEGYKSFNQTIELESGRTYELREPLKKLETGTSKIFVESTPPGGQVKVDGDAVKDPTPVTVEELAEGSHRVVVSKEGYADYEEEVELERGEERELEVELRPKEVTLTVKSDPDDADFTILGEEGDAVESGETPETVEGLDGGASYRVEFARSGYEDAETEFEPGADEEATVDVELERETRRVAGAQGSSSTSGTTTGGTSGSGSGDTTGSSLGGTSETNSSGTGEGGTSGSSSGSGSSGGSGSGGEEQPTGKATLKINSVPVARVHIDGKDTGQRTPLLNYEVEAGKHEIQFINEEFGLRKTRYVNVKPGDTKKIIVRAKE